MEEKYKIMPDDAMAPVKSKLPFIKKLDAFLEEKRRAAIAPADIRDNELGTVLSKENIRETMERNPQMSLLQLEKLLNERLKSRLKFLCTEKRADTA